MYGTRQSVALLLVAVTTFGWGTRPAAAAIETTTKATAATVQKVNPPRNAAETALQLRDALDAIRFELDYESEARDARALGVICANVTTLAAHLREADGMDELVDAAASTVAVCEAPMRASNDDAQRAIEDALRYRELSFDVAA